MEFKTLRALLIAGAPVDVITGCKRISIRTGHRDYVEGGHMLIGCHKTNWCVLATCTEVRYCKMSTITVQEVIDEGFDTLYELFKHLQQYYPVLDWDTEMTVVRWSRPEGALCDD